MAMSTEALVVIGSIYSVMMTDKLQFSRPWIIHPRMRKGLDELVAAGFLTVEPLNQTKSPPLIWKPTDKMRNERPKVSRKFLKRHTFPFTTE